jgi:large subunit ribosomal protein L21
MYAIVKTGGKQYRVERGQTLLVERLDAGEGADVALEPVLYRSEEAIFDKDGLGGVTVTAKVLEHVRGEKLRVFKFKPKRGYKRRTGHRQPLTRIEVTDITAGGAKPRAKRAKAADGAQGAAPTRATAPKAAAARATKSDDAPGAGPSKAQAAKPDAAKADAAKAADGPKAQDAPKAAAKGGTKAAPKAKPKAPRAAKAKPTQKGKAEDGS